MKSFMDENVDRIGRPAALARTVTNSGSGKVVPVGAAGSPRIERENYRELPIMDSAPIDRAPASSECANQTPRFPSPASFILTILLFLVLLESHPQNY